MKNTAFERGTKAADFYKNITKTARVLNAASVEWAERHSLPTILGRLPVPAGILVLLTFALIAGLVVGGIMLLSAVFLYMISNIVIQKHDEKTSVFGKPESYGGAVYKNGSNGYGYYTESSDGSVTSYKVDLEDEDD